MKRTTKAMAQNGSNRLGGEQKVRGSGRISSMALREIEIPTKEVQEDVRNPFCINCLSRSQTVDREVSAPRTTGTGPQ